MLAAEVFCAAERFEHGGEIGTEHFAGHRRHLRWIIQLPDDDDAIGGCDRLARPRQRAIPSGRGRKVDDHGSRTHRRHHVLCDQRHSLSIRDERGGDHDVDVLHDACVGRKLCSREGVSDLSRVAAYSLTSNARSVHSHEFGAHTLDLLTRGLTDVVGDHLRTHGVGGGDCAEASDTCADDEDTRGWHRAKGRHGGSGKPW
mmetsp:Transcript_100342/g.283046  ORF Transcript_100342/g.283046 Transcript_100342/m.283046 type:complete len:201 (-) Transcript_100342:2017-2619(-)